MLELAALRARPDLLAQVFSPAIQGTWPGSMQRDTTAHLYFGARVRLDASGAFWRSAIACCR